MKVINASIVSVALAAAYAAFLLWYTALRGPLSAAEVDGYVGVFAAQGLDDDALARIRGFLERDTGDDFVMVNVIELREPPLRVEGVAPGETASQVMGRYMEYMWPALLRRACHPVLMGRAAAPALDLWNLENGRDWSQAGLMRYRSRRDMMEIATNPAFQGRHEFKVAAMLKTAAFPIDPWYQLGDPRLVGGLVVAVVVLALQLVAARSRAVRR
jgi:hypothetical protein